MNRASWPTCQILTKHSGRLRELNRRLRYERFQWVIVGGESGPGSRPIEADWVRDIRDECVAAGTPFFFKQWGGTNKKKSGRRLDDRTWDDMRDRSSKHAVASLL